MRYLLHKIQIDWTIPQTLRKWELGVHFYTFCMKLYVYEHKGFLEAQGCKLALPAISRLWKCHAFRAKCRQACLELFGERQHTIDR
jgi:hypothetical protein